MAFLKKLFVAESLFFLLLASGLSAQVAKPDVGEKEMLAKKAA